MPTESTRFTTPAMVEQHNGNTVLVEIGADKNVYFDWQKSDGTWAGWTGLSSAGGGFISMISLSGQVTAGGSGLTGVTVTLTGSTAAGTNVSQTIITDSNGNYAFSVPVGGTYTVTPALPGYAFSPPSQSFSNLNGNLTAFPAEDPNPFNITGTWQQASTFAGTWNVTQNEASVSGTVNSSAGINCGSITWQVSGQLTDASSGTYDLIATNPSAQTDSCGNTSAVEQEEHVVLAISNKSASSLDESVFQTGTVTGDSSWTKSGSTATATLSGSPGIPLNGSSIYNVGLGSSSSITLTISDNGSGSAGFANGSTTTTVTQSGNVTVYGKAVSGHNNDISITATSPTDPSAFARLYVTVVSVQLTMRNSGNLSQDNSAAANYRRLVGNTLGPLIAIGTAQTGPYCAEGLEYLGTVAPNDYQGAIVLRRTVTSKTYQGNNLVNQGGSADDTSFSQFRVDTPTSAGHVYDTDAPGITTDGIAAPASNLGCQSEAKF